MKKNILIAAALTLASGLTAAAADYDITAAPVTAEKGTTVNVTVSLTNAQAVRGMQCDITPSPQLTVVPGNIALVDERAPQHQLRATLLPTDAILVTVTDLGGDTSLAAGDGALFTIPVQVPEFAGEYSLTLSYVVLSVEGVGRVRLNDLVIPINVKDAVTDLDVVEADAAADTRWFDIRGIEVAHPGGGVYIRVDGDTASKHALK